MNTEPLKRFFWSSVSEAAVSTGQVLTIPSTLTKDMAKELVDRLPMDRLLHDLAVIAAGEVGDLLAAKSLRPSDYCGVKVIPDTIVEHLIEVLAKKPDVFFKVFDDSLKLKG
jgi:hypothetical protein